MLKKTAFMLLLCLVGLLSMGNIWYWTDENGVRHYSNVSMPEDRTVQELEESKKVFETLKKDTSNRHLFRVVRVFDGDTVQVTGLDLKFTIRLVGIDAPEFGHSRAPDQPFCEKARAALTRLVLGKDIRIKSYGVGGYNRQLAEIFLDDKNINLEMIRLGLAEVYTGRLPKNLASRRYFSMQSAAQKKRIGIWRLGSAYLSPKKWRKKHPRK